MFNEDDSCPHMSQKLYWLNKWEKRLRIIPEKNSNCGNHNVNVPFEYKFRNSKLIYKHIFEKLCEKVCSTRPKGAWSFNGLTYLYSGVNKIELI